VLRSNRPIHLGRRRGSGCPSNGVMGNRDGLGKAQKGMCDALCKRTLFTSLNTYSRDIYISRHPEFMIRLSEIRVPPPPFLQIPPESVKSRPGNERDRPFLTLVGSGSRMSCSARRNGSAKKTTWERWYDQRWYQVRPGPTEPITRAQIATTIMSVRSRTLRMGILRPLDDRPARRPDHAHPNKFGAHPRFAAGIMARYRRLP
jgi:hypothetical protein